LPAFFRAVESAMATACFRGLPAFTSVFIFLETASREHPRINGMSFSIGFGTIVSCVKNWKHRIDFGGH